MLHAESVAGSIRVVLAIRLNDRVHIVGRLWHGTRPLSRKGVSVSLFQPLHPKTQARLMRAKGNTYEAVLPVGKPGWWVLIVQVPTGTQEDTIPFLLRTTTSSEQGQALYPVFTPLGKMQASVSLPLGSEVAIVRVVIGAIGITNFLISLRQAMRQLPVRLRLELAMQDMTMATITVMAHPVRNGQYAARAFFSMPGIWRVEVSDGRVHATADLVIGKPVNGW